MSGWTSLLIVGAGVVALALAVIRLRRRPRGGNALRDYLRHFDALGVSDDVSLTIFHHFQRWMSDAERSFPVRPDDPLSVYGIAPGDVDDALAILLTECGRKRAADTTPAPIATVDDLVRTVAASPRAAEPERRA